MSNTLQPKIHAAMIEVMANVGAIAKDKKNAQQGFKFRGIDDVYNALHSIMATAGVYSVPEVIDCNSEERRTQKGTILLYEKYLIKYTFYAEDGSSVSATVKGIGMDSGDKAGNKAMAVAHKYALLQAFCIPTNDMADPDAETPPQSEPQRPGEGRPNDAPPTKETRQLTTVQKIAIAWRDIAGKSPLIADDHKRVRLAFMAKCLGKERLESSKDLTDAQQRTILMMLEKTPKMAQNFISVWVDENYPPTGGPKE